jgi:hypothetical protein
MLTSSALGLDFRSMQHPIDIVSHQVIGTIYADDTTANIEDVFPDLANDAIALSNVHVPPQKVVLQISNISLVSDDMCVQENESQREDIHF